jgi:hypothetical protein
MAIEMKRFGIFKKLADGKRVFVGLNEDESSAKTRAILLKEQPGTDFLVFNLRTKRKKFETGLYDHLKKMEHGEGAATGSEGTEF